jgi:Tol biopolymer transport system component
MYNSAIHVVSADGGTSVPVTELDEQARENSHRFPFFLPDGKHFLYLERMADGTGAENRVRIGHADGDDALDPDDAGVLVETPSQATYRAGRLLYLKDGVLLARPFDPDTRKLSGQPVPVVSNVDIIDGAARAVFSTSDDGKLIYMTEDRSQGHGLVWFDRTGKLLQDMADQGQLYAVTLSPDGRRFAARIADDLWVFDVDRLTRRRVTYSQASADAPVWTPDGKRLIFRAQGEPYKDI